MELQYLKIFNTLAIEQSFTKTAEKLHISQPAISIQIRKLEESLDMKLFNRINNKVELNENGRILFEATRKIFDIIEETEYQLLNKKDYIGGFVRLGGSNSPGTYILPKIIGEFKQEHPRVNINLHIANTSEIAEKVIRGDLDFAVNGGNATYPKNIYVEKVMEDRVVLAISPSNPLAGQEIRDASELEKLNFITHEVDSRMYRLAMDIIEELGIKAKITMTFGSMEALKQSVMAGLGIVPLSYSSVAAELKLGLISEVRIEGKSWYYPYSIIYNKNKYMTPAAKKLIDLVRDRMSAKK